MPPPPRPTQRVTRSANKPQAPTPPKIKLVSSSTSSRRGGGASSASSSAPRPRPTLPIEILSHIIKLVFSGPLFTRPASPFRSSLASPFKPYAALLLASRAVRALALPFVYRSVTIARPRDFVTFFGAIGVFTSGPDLAEKRAALKEICLVEDVEFPLSLDPAVWAPEVFAEIDQGAGRACLTKMDFSGLEVGSLTVLSLPTSAVATVDPAVRPEEVDTLANTLVRDPAIVTALTHRLTSHPLLSHLLAKPDGISSAIRTTIEWARQQSQTSGLLLFLRTIKPTTIRFSPEYSTRLVAHGEEVFLEQVRVQTYRPNETEAAEREARSWSVGVEEALGTAFPGHEHVRRGTARKKE